MGIRQGFRNRFPVRVGQCPEPVRDFQEAFKELDAAFGDREPSGSRVVDPHVFCGLFQVRDGYRDGFSDTAAIHFAFEPRKGRMPPRRVRFERRADVGVDRPLVFRVGYR